MTTYYFSQKFKSVYSPHKEVAIDEAMIKFTGRSSLKQYMPMKPIKRGIKVWVLGDSSNGYFSNFQIYTGKVGATAETCLGARVVKDLTHDLKGKYHHVCFFLITFSSVSLLVDLEKDGIYSCGTARKDRRGFPMALKKPSLPNRCVTILLLYTYLHTLAYVFVHVYMWNGKEGGCPDFFSSS